MSSYYDVSEFLADGQKLPCKVSITINNAGHLEGTADKDLKEGTPLELPYWIAHTLSAKDWVTINLPRPYTAPVCNALSASSESVNLRNLGGGGGAFYAGGSRLTDMTELPELAIILNQAFKERMMQIMDQSQHTSADSGGEGAAYQFAQNLDEWEKELFVSGESAARAMKVWGEFKKKSVH